MPVCSEPLVFCSRGVPGILQTHAERSRSSLESFTAESEKRSRQALDRIANEEEQLRLKQEHVDLDEKLVVEEQQQVWVFVRASRCVQYVHVCVCARVCVRWKLPSMFKRLKT